MSGFNENIRKYREIKGMSQEQLATAMGKKSKNTVSGWENGSHDVRISDLQRLCEVLDVDVDTLLGFQNDEQKIAGVADMVATEIMKGPLVKQIEDEISRMSDAELKRFLRLAHAAKDEE